MAAIQHAIVSEQPTGSSLSTGRAITPTETTTGEQPLLFSESELTTSSPGEQQPSMFSESELTSPGERPTSSSLSSGSEFTPPGEQPTSSSLSSETETPIATPSRKRLRKVGEWKATRRRMKRNSGQAYTSVKGRQVNRH